MKKKSSKKNKFIYRVHPIRIIGDIIVIGSLYTLDNMADPYYVRVFLYLMFGYIFLRLWEIIRGGLW